MQEAGGSLQGGEGLSVVRLHVGGLGPSVISSDLLQTFSSLVHVSSVDVVRSKGRSFAYLTIQAEPHDLKRLFSLPEGEELDDILVPEKFLAHKERNSEKVARRYGEAQNFSRMDAKWTEEAELYNGCMWKGGCLKLEKAREFYMDKLHREWIDRDCPQNLNESKLESATQARNDPKLKKSNGLNIYFPKLRKFKKIPEKGLGKHKRSFERVEPLRHSLLRLCNCDQECMTACTYQSLAKKDPLCMDREEMRQRGVADKLSKNKAISKSHLSYHVSGKKGNQVSEGEQRGGGKRGSAEVPDLNDLHVNMKGGMPNAEIDETQKIGDFDEPILNITGLEFITGQDKNSEDQPSQKEEAQRKVERVHTKGKRPKVEHHLFPKTEDRWHSRIDEGTNQILQGEEVIGSKFSRSSVGRNWVQKASWTSLVGGTSQVRFSLGSVLKQAQQEGVEQRAEAYQ
ncbi:hypothetical protein L7F22_029580 [Adiantum nelumboides]|nr:hypothetical protein [Adiantum nelumboides]